MVVNKYDFKGRFSINVNRLDETVSLWGFCPIRFLICLFLYLDTTRMGDAVVKIIAYISQSPCILIRNFNVQSFFFGCNLVGKIDYVTIQHQVAYLIRNYTTCLFITCFCFTNIEKCQKKYANFTKHCLRGIEYNVERRVVLSLVVTLVYYKRFLHSTLEHF